MSEIDFGNQIADLSIRIKEVENGFRVFENMVQGLEQTAIGLQQDIEYLKTVSGIKDDNKAKSKCIVCNKALTKNKSYLMSDGFVCDECFSRQEDIT